MAQLPIIDETASRIFSLYERRNQAEPRRGHLGASVIGRPCERQLWFDFRWVLNDGFDGRMLRLFERGKREEEWIVDDLRSIGIDVREVDESGKQFRLSDFGGHFGGSMDGCALGVIEAPKTWHVLEFKTHGEKSFKALAASGVEKAKPEHFAQMMVYMGLTSMTRALYIAVNKNTDEIYTERIRFDALVFQQLRAKAERVIFSPLPLPHISKQQSFACRWCKYSTICNDRQVVAPNINCRTCTNSTPREDGTWFCETRKKVLSVSEQAAGCEEHLYHPALFEDSTEGANYNGATVEYTGRDGRKFLNEQGKGLRVI